MVSVAVNVGVREGVCDGEPVMVTDAVGLSVREGLGLLLGVALGLGLIVRVNVGLTVMLKVEVGLRVRVCVAVAVRVGVLLGVPQLLRITRRALDSCSQSVARL